MYLVLAVFGIKESAASNLPLTKENIASELDKLQKGQPETVGGESGLVKKRYDNALAAVQAAQKACTEGKPECEGLLKTATSVVYTLDMTESRALATPLNPSLQSGGGADAVTKIKIMENDMKKVDAIITQIAIANPETLFDYREQLGFYAKRREECNTAFSKAKVESELQKCVADMANQLPIFDRINSQVSPLGPKVDARVAGKLGATTGGRKATVSSLGSAKKTPAQNQ